MGDWGAKPWETDEAADWFGKFMKGCDLSPIKDCIDSFNQIDENYEEVRAACYLLQFLANPYIWPQNKQSGSAKTLLAKGIEILENMINPNSQWSFLDMCDSDSDVIESVNNQIVELKKRHSEWKSEFMLDD